MGIDHRARRAVFLDRDGVIVAAVVRAGRPYPPSGPADAEVPAGTSLSLARLKAAGFLLVVVTNQPDVARGTTTREEVERLHAWLRGALPLDEIRACYHDDGDRCGCRKPAPGLLIAAAADLGVDLGRSVMVGDRWRDIEAGRRAGCATVFIDHGYAERRAEAPDGVVSSLPEAVDWILRRCGDDS
jgi:D-glycero-D-manno-heptose 1,7-bisphosphate phosphatase